jgi:predicted metal-dependent hydrolase
VKKKDGVLLHKYRYLCGIIRENLAKTCQRRNSCQTQIREFLLKKSAWLETVIPKVQKQSFLPRRQYVSGEFHSLWGESCRLTVLPTEGKGRVAVTDREMILFAGTNATTEQKKAFVTEFYRAQVNDQASHLLDSWPQRAGVTITCWQVRNMRRRWGSCLVPQKKINLSLQLAMKPLSCLEYVIVHELCHLLVPNHSPAFYKLLEKFLPHWQEQRCLLRQPDLFWTGRTS